MRPVRLPLKPLALAFLAAAPALALPAAAEEPRPRIIVSGEGRVAAAPDMAILSVGVVTAGPEAGQVLAENSRRLAEVLALAQGAGIAERDLQTSGLSLSPIYDYETRGPDGQPRITGYQATNTLSIRVRDLAALGGLLDAMVQGGANQLNGLSFAVAEPAALRDEARRRAAADARARAALYAEALGVKLGPVLSLTESGGFSPQPYMMRDAAMAAPAAAPVPVAAGEIEYTASVTVEFAIAP